MVDATHQSVAKKLTRVVVILLVVTASLAGLLALLVYLALYDSETLRYRLTYEVEVDGEVRSGTGVVQVHIYEQPTSIAQSEIGFEVTGEAIAVDLGDRGYLLSLLSGRAVRVNEWSGHITTPDKLLWLAFDCPSEDAMDYFHCLQEKRLTVELPFRLLPGLATIEDINDPESLRLVDPSGLAASFGHGTSLKRVTIEITDDPVTIGRIRVLLPWLEDLDTRVTTSDTTFYRSYFERDGR